jgi:amino acid adenylation domain-containing protein
MQLQPAEQRRRGAAGSRDLRIDEAERRRLLFEWNDTAADYPHDRCVHEIFAERARSRPEATAILCGAERLSYGDLDRRANGLAHRLREYGVGPEVVVGLAVERSLDMVVALLAILKAGGAYLPLDPAYPRERLAYMLQDAGAPLVVASAAAGEAFADHATTLLVLDAEAIAGSADSAPNSGACADSLAYVMYTSGSTGLPKGIAVVHSNISRLVIGANYVDIDADDVFLQLAPLAFDAATFEIWGPLLNGATLALYPGGMVDFARLGKVIATAGVSILWLTAGLFHRIIDECPAILTSVKQLLAGGEALSAPHVRRALELLPGCRLINGYGPTECTTFSVCHRLAKADATGASVPIGRPVSNAQAYVLGPDLELLPIGEAGELCIGGDGLARGYFNNPALTAERFVENPFGPPGSRLYRTGDLVRYRSDGVIEFLGRLDRQIKIRGYRVEPGEIEAALLLQAGVRQALVAVHADAAGDKRLIAYLVADSGAVPEPDRLLAGLKDRLPAYMTPAAIVMLDTLPLTPNGKIDHAALPPPQWVPARRRRAGMPLTPVEKAVAEVWSSVLQVDDIGVGDEFFARGGTRAGLAEAFARLNARFGVALEPAAAGPKPTVAALVNHLRMKLANREMQERL